MLRSSNRVIPCMCILSLLTVSLLAIHHTLAMNENKSRDDADRQQLWQQVEKNVNEGLPESAIANLKKIYASASADQKYPEATYALCRQFLIEGQKNQPFAPYVIKQMQTAIPDAPAAMQPILKAVLAKNFFSFYQQNRWQFQQRSQTTSAPSEDFETWDLSRILGETDKRFTEALDSADALKKIPLADCDPLIVKGNVDEFHRPTLYDFIAFEALEFYALDEQFIRQQGAFEINADSPVFASAEEFLNWNPPTNDEDSYLLRAVRLYQDLLRFHQADDNQTAWLDADLGRLTFGHTIANGSEANTRYRAALRRFADQHLKHPLSALALANLAQSTRAEDDRVKAWEIATEGLNRFPDSVGGRQCQNLINEIKAKSAGVGTEHLWSRTPTTIDVNYKNIDKVWMRLIEFDFENWQEWGQYQTIQNLQRDQLIKLVNGRNVAQWSANLPVTDDYKERTESISLPANINLKSGCYLLACSCNESFSEEQNAVSVAEVWVSQLAVVLKHQPEVNQIEGYVVDADSGEPLAGVNIRKWSWKQDGRNSRQVDSTSRTTDSNGLFSLKNSGNLMTKLDFSHNNQKFGAVEYISHHNRQMGSSSSSTTFFTDRSIYRPGQSIQFKGICAQANQLTNQYKTLADRTVTVILYDANNQEVEKREFRTNEFGSFSGSFTAPRDRATGSFRLAATGIDGATQVRVEEYKRPKFFVEVDQPAAEVRLNQAVKITGHATAYTGAPIDGSKVSFRVVREVRYPFWYCMRCWYMPMPTNSQEISHGTTETNAEGNFDIEFTALPDNSVDRASDPVFNYTIYADVTDSAGETRSASQTTTVGYRALEAVLKSANWLTSDSPIELALSVTTLDGTGQSSKGSLKIFALTAPEKIVRAELQGPRYWRPSPAESKPDLSKINAWPAGEAVLTKDVATDDSGKVISKLQLAAGAYKAVYETTDAAGQKVLAELPLLVVDPANDKFAIKIPEFFQTKSNSVEPGEEFVAVWGTGYETGRAFIEFEHRGKVVKSYWTDKGTTQHTIKIPIEEKHRGGLQLRISYVRENRLYSENLAIAVPWTNKKLAIKWEHFVSKLTPGGRETWTAIVSGPKAERVVAEMVAGMYDASLDAFASHQWQAAFNVFYQNYSSTQLRFFNQQQYFNNIYHDFGVPYVDTTITYPQFNQQLQLQNYGYGYGGGRGGIGVEGRMMMSRGMVAEGAMPAAAPMSDGLAMADESVSSLQFKSAAKEKTSGVAPGTASSSDSTPVDLDNVSARTNLQETAFFFPNLVSGKDGSVRIEFEIPEALTKWKFFGFAHDKDLRAALLSDEITTSKDLMVQPNPPRFLREGDLLEFSVKVTNQSDETQIGSLRLTFADARTSDSVDSAFGNEQLDQSFEVPAKQSKSLFWKIKVPDFVGVLTYKAVGATESVSDGEEGFLPVLSKRILVTESLPLPIRGNQTRHFDFEQLLNAASSDSLRSQTLTVQMTSNPAWYAVMSLPYLMEFPHECSEQTFNRVYANAIGQHIVNSDPKIERIFEQWRNTPALDSPLEKNDDIRNVTIAESPWLLAGKKESAARRDVGILFDKNRLTSEQQRGLEKLAQMQMSDGAWPWFPGGPANDYITLYVTTGFGRLRNLGIEVDMTVALKAVDRLDWFIDQQYQEIKRGGHLGNNNLSQTVCLYLYGRSFFLKDRPINDNYRESFDYFVGQAKQYWVKLGDRQSQGHVAIGLKRIGNNETPAAIMKSLTERSLSDDEMGMFWREGEPSWWWYRAPIETQALMIEAYDEVAGDAAKVEELKIWLLKQKQTQNWKTTKATADACYGLLLRGSNLLASDKRVTVKLAGVEIKPENVEAGTGFYEQKFVRNEIKPKMGSIDVAKSDDGIAWGSIHWQYLEDVSKIKPYEGTPLTLKKTLFIKKNTDKGPVIEPITGPVSVGDELRMRIELRVDRDMEFVHLKDYRGSGTEPVNVLSQYKYQDGLAYYESTKDTASHFFIDYLPRGTYVFEYSVRVQHRGVYETGIAELQCMYAPEFNSHSGSVELTVQ